MSTAPATLQTTPKTRTPTFPFRQLLQKELRLQRGNFLFACAATVLGMVALPLIASNSQALGGFPPRDIQMGLLLAGLLPVLVAILPAMIGSTAAAAEKPMGVLAWQSALPIRHEQVIAIKMLAVSILCFIVGGIFPYILQQLALEADILSQTFRGFWTGWHALLFGAIGFYAGSFAKDDYQGLLISIIPSAVLIAVFALTDPFLRVLPFSNLPLSRPWLVIIRLLLIIALLVMLATRMHIRIPVRRWRWMIGSLAMLCCASGLLTLVNIELEGHVLGSPGSTQRKFLSTEPTSAKYDRAETRSIASLSRGWAANYLPRTLDNGNRIVIGSVTYNAKYTGKASNSSSPGHVNYASGTFVIASADGQVREFPQLFESLQDMSITGVSGNHEWVLISQNGKDSYLCGPMSISIPLLYLPNRISDAIVNGLHMHYIINEGWGWGLSLDKLEIGQNDLYLEGIKGAGYVIRGGANQFPEDTRQYIYSYRNPGVYQVGVQPGNTPVNHPSYSAILRNGKARGELELVGFVNGDMNGVSSDGEWVAAAGENGLVYRHVQPLQEALAQPVFSEFNNQSGRRFFNTIEQDNGTTRVSSGLFWAMPVIQTADGPATIMKYVTVASIQVTTQVIQQQTFYKSVFICDDIGVDIVNLENGTSSSVSLKLPGEDKIALPQVGVNAMVYQAISAPIFLDSVWFQPSRTLSLTANGTIRLADFSDYEKTNAPQMTIARRHTEYPGHDYGGLITPNKFLQAGSRDFWLSEW